MFREAYQKQKSNMCRFKRWLSVSNTSLYKGSFFCYRRQVVHYPDDFQFGRSPQPNLASPFTGVKGSSVKPFSATLQQPTITVNPAEPLEIESRFIAGANLQRASRESPFSVSRQYDKLTPLNSTQRDSNGFSSVPSMTRQTNSSIV